MTTDTLHTLLNSLNTSLSSASKSLPTSVTLAPPSDGISLLDTKNELLLSYLHNLVFLILIKLRSQKENANDSADDALGGEARKKLVELRVYLEKGIRPLEGKLKYQIDKLVLAATDATNKPASNGVARHLHAAKGAGAELGSEFDTFTLPQADSEQIYRPNPAAFVRPSQADKKADQGRTGIYKPPRITPTALVSADRRQKPSKPRTSHTVDAFIREELDDAPIAEPSIGAGSGLRGREKEEEEERRGYEEMNLTRLPGEKKAKRRRPDEELSAGFGGLGDVDFGDLKSGKRKRREEGRGLEIGEGWEKRKKRGVGRKRR
ncbi:hypothetical protein MMC21_003166 [Puttea exsequens]|nr:hypothetical protein [Puttea exsequens]